MDYLRKLGLVFIIVAVFFSVIIILGNLFGKWAVIGSIIVFIIVSIILYNINDRKTRCPRQK